MAKSKRKRATERTKIQAKIARTLKRMDKSPYWLGQQCGFPGRCSVYKMLSSPTTPIRAIQKMCDVLNLRFVWRGELATVAQAEPAGENSK